MTMAALLRGDARDEEEEQKAKGNKEAREEEMEGEVGGGELSSPPISSFGSAKLDALMAIVLAVAERNRRARGEEAGRGSIGSGGPGSSYVPEKVVVFSQWTSMLDLVCSALDSEGVRFSRIDGSMNPAQRSAAVAAFQSEGDG